MTKQKDKYRPTAESSWFGSLLPTYLFMHIFRSLIKPVSKEQFYDLPAHLHPATNYQRLLKQKSNPTVSGPANNSLMQRLFNAFKPKLMVAALLVLVSTVLAMVGPMFLKKIIHFLEKHKTLRLEQHNAQYYLLVWLGLYVLRIFFGELGDKQFFDSGIAVDQALTEAITEKLSRLPMTVKRHIPKGELMNYVMIDVKLVGYFFKYVSVAVSSPVTLLFATILLLFSGQSYNIIMAFVLLQFASVLFFIAQRMSAHKRNKFEQQY